MLPRPVTVFAGVLVLAALAIWALPPLVYWIDGYWLWAVGIAAVAAWFSRSRTGRSGITTWASRGEFLCDSCKYDHPNLCDRRERPNATSCPDYRQRG